MPSFKAVKEIMRHHLGLNSKDKELGIQAKKCYEKLKKNWGKGNDWCLEVYNFANKYLKKNK